MKRSNVVLTPDTAFMVIQEMEELKACRQMVEILSDNIAQLKNINNEKQVQLTNYEKATDNQRQIIENLKAEIQQNTNDKKELQRQLRSQSRLSRFLNIALPVLASVLTIAITK